MGFNLGKVVKSVSKGVSKTVSNVGKAVSNASGQVASTSLDVVTLGQKKSLNNATGGALDAVEGVARGNTKDVIRVGATTAAGVYGGPTAALAVNQAFASGASPLKALGSVASSVASPGGDMDWLNQIGNVVNSPIANQILGLNKPAPAPAAAAPVMYAPTVTPSVKAGMDSSTMMMIAGGVLAVVLVLVFALRKK